MRVKTNLLEINKPSELCQVLYFEDYKKMVFAQLTPTQIDLMNLLIYEAHKQIVKNKIEINTDYASIPFKIKLQTISNHLNKYANSDYHQLLNQLNGLRKLDIIINILLKNKTMEHTLTTLIHEINVSRHKNSLNKIITIHLSTKIISMFLNVNKLFSKMHLTIQISMKSKYSKLLYEILRDYLGKDYNGIKSKNIDFELLLGLLNTTNSGRYFNFSYFNNDILKKAVKEINEKSDIKVSYEPIKERTEDNPRLHVTKIKFTMEKQSDERLKELGLLDQPEELSIEEQILQNKLKLKSKSKLEKLTQNGYEVKDEEAWIKADFNKNKDLYEAQIKLDDYLDQIEEMEKEDKFELMSGLAQHLNSSDPIVTIDNYLIKDLSGNILTSSAQETREVILKFQDK